MNVKALILAAGLGIRFRPITLRKPKPLIPFFDQPLLRLIANKITSAGINEIAINTHYLADQIHQEASLWRAVAAPRISYEPEILGTGGAIPPLDSWRGGSSLLIYNSDIICDVDLNAVVDMHNKSGAAATIVVRSGTPRTANPIVTLTGELIAVPGTAVRHQKIQLLRGQHARRDFTGIHIVSNKLIHSISPGCISDIWSAYAEVMRQGERVAVFEHAGIWEDIGTPAFYFSAHQIFWEKIITQGFTEEFRGLGFSKELLAKINDQIYETTSGKKFFAGTNTVFDKNIYTDGMVCFFENSRIERATNAANTIALGQSTLKSHDLYRQCVIDQDIKISV